MTSSNPDRPTTNGSTSEPLTAISDDVRTLIGQELTNARTELSGKARTASKGMIMLGAKGAPGGLAAGTATAPLERTFDQVLPAPDVAAATALLGAGPGALAAAGAELRRVPPVVPTETLDGAGDSVRPAAAEQNR